MIKKFLEYNINEKMGVSDDGEILSDYLINKLNNSIPDKIYIFIKPEYKDTIEIGNKDNIFIYDDLPQLEKNVYKVIVKYVIDPKGSGLMAYFDPKSSKYTKNGFVLHFTFMKPPNRSKIWKHYIYHEVHHGIQYLYIGKKKMIYTPKNLKVNLISSFKKSILINVFMDCLYHSIQFEQGALVAQFYGKMKYKKNIKSIEDLRRYFEKGNTYEYGVAYKLHNIDLIDLFETTYKNEKGEDIRVISKVDLLVFFTLFKKMGKIISQFKTPDELGKFIGDFDFAEDFKSISEDELISTLNKYTKYFNKIGYNLIKKLDKTYPLLLDYYTKKFESTE